MSLQNDFLAILNQLRTYSVADAEKAIGMRFALGLRDAILRKFGSRISTNLAAEIAFSIKTNIASMPEELLEPAIEAYANMVFVANEVLDKNHVNNPNILIKFMEHATLTYE